MEKYPICSSHEGTTSCAPRVLVSQNSKDLPVFSLSSYRCSVKLSLCRGPRSTVMVEGILNIQHGGQDGEELVYLSEETRAQGLKTPEA